MSQNKRPHESNNYKRQKITLQIKREIIVDRELGVSVADLARKYNRSTSTICTILKNKDKIKEVDASKGVTRISTQRLPILDDVERLLLIWINEKQLQAEPINEGIICEKAKLIFADLVKRTPASSRAGDEVFKASRGWFQNFKRRTGVMRHEGASSDGKTAEDFIADFKRLVDFDGYLPQQVFNCDETSLFLKKMPKRAYITTDAINPIKDRLTLIFCVNASGDLKIKPFFVYNSESLGACSKCTVPKNEINFRSNNQALVTRVIFTDWINKVFAPSVKKYLLEKNLPLHVLLVLDNATAHPPSLQNDILDEYNFIKILFLPPSITSLLQPMDQKIISNFKKLYTKSLFELCFEMTERSNLTLVEFLNYHFHIVAYIKMIEKAWEEVTEKTLNSAWRNLWSESVVEYDVEVSEDSVVNEILYLANVLGIEMEKYDIDELVDEHRQELTTEELMELHSQQEDVEERFSADDEMVVEKHQSSGEVREMLKAWVTVASYIEKHHPNEEMAVRAINVFNVDAVSHFYHILKRRQKKKSSDTANMKKECKVIPDVEYNTLESVMDVCVKKEPEEFSCSDGGEESAIVFEVATIKQEIETEDDGLS